MQSYFTQISCLKAHALSEDQKLKVVESLTLRRMFVKQNSFTQHWENLLELKQGVVEETKSAPKQ